MLTLLARAGRLAAEQYVYILRTFKNIYLKSWKKLDSGHFLKRKNDLIRKNLAFDYSIIFRKGFKKTYIYYLLYCRNADRV